MHHQPLRLPHLGILLSLGTGEIDKVEAGHSRAREAFLFHHLRGLDDQREHGVGARGLSIHGGLPDVPVPETSVEYLAR